MRKVIQITSAVLLLSLAVAAFFIGRNIGYDLGFDDGWDLGAVQTESGFAHMFGCFNDEDGYYIEGCNEDSVRIVREHKGLAPEWWKAE